MGGEKTWKGLLQTKIIVITAQNNQTLGLNSDVKNCGDENVRDFPFVGNARLYRTSLHVQMRGKTNSLKHIWPLNTP